MIPRFGLRIDGADVTDAVETRLRSLRVTLSSDADSDSLDLELTGADVRAPPMGAAMDVDLGWAGAPLTPMGRYLHALTEIEVAPRTLKMRAAAADFRRQSTLKAPRSRAFDSATLGDVLETIAGEHDYTAAVAPALAAVTVDHLDQTAESDLHLLRRLARAHGATFKATDGRLVFMPRGSAQSTTGRALPETVWGPGDLIRGSVRRADRGRYRSVRARVHNLGLAAPAVEVAGTGSPAFEIRESFATPEEALAAAEAKFARLSKATATLRATVMGDPGLISEAPVRTAGQGDGVDGSWIVTRVVHILDVQRGYLCEVEADAR